MHLIHHFKETFSNFFLFTIQVTIWQILVRLNFSSWLLLIVILDYTFNKEAKGFWKYSERWAVSTSTTLETADVWDYVGSINKFILAVSVYLTFVLWWSFSAYGYGVSLRQIVLSLHLFNFQGV